jgi:hypothetical protein
MIVSMPASLVPYMGSATVESIPYMGIGYRHTCGMPSDDMDEHADGHRSAREILSKNVRRLIDDARETRPHLGSILKVAEASSRLTHGSTSLSKSRVGRIVTGSHPTDIDALTDLAEVFGLQPWQLLVEDLNPKALPQLADADFLSQLKRIVGVAGAGNLDPATSPKDELPLQTEQGPRVAVGPALREAFTLGRDKNASRGPAEAQKQKGSRRR